MNLALIVWLVLSLIWSSTWLFIKLGLRDLPPFTFAGLRFLLAAMILWLIVWARRRALPRRELPVLALTGLFGIGINFGLIFWAEQRITSGLAAVLQATIPVFGLFFAHHYLPGERITGRKLCGVTLGVAGTALIFYNQLRVADTAALRGSAALLASALIVAGVNVVSKRHLQHLAPEVSAATQMTCGFAPLLLAGTVIEGNPLQLHWTPLALLCLLYLSLIGSVTAFLLYFWLLRRIAVTKLMLISLVTPVLALLLGKLTLDEEVTWRVAAGSAAILAGISLIVVPARSERA
jgi:drug/metabolite transporter (DMT)-like permease